MKVTTYPILLLALVGAGCATAPPPAVIATTELPNCFDSNYSASDQLFTIKSASTKTVNQQCLLTVVPRDRVSRGQLAAGSYLVSASDGGGGGAGGTMHDDSRFPGENHGGGGGGGGAGAMETQAKINLIEGTYRLTIGAGGLGGSACSGAPHYFAGGPGWLGSPTNIVRVTTGEVLLGAAGAELYARPTRGQNEKLAGKKRDGHGGGGPGNTSGGHGTTFTPSGKIDHVATAGAEAPTFTQVKQGGEPGNVLPNDRQSGPGPGGGGGASSRAGGGAGGGDLPGHKPLPPQPGTLGSGGGGGSGDLYGCDGGANGGHGYVAFKPL